MLIYTINELILIFQLRLEHQNPINNSNINLKDKFFLLPEVKKQIKKNNLTNIETIYGVSGNVGNALISLNNLINICEKILCKNIVLKGLNNIIKNPIFYKNYNITIFPNLYENITKIDIRLSVKSAFYFSYKKNHKMRLGIIRDELFKNIPKYKSKPNDLYINIRSGDIFINKINPHYSQPPLCFYQKIIIENKFNKIFILSNGHENPVVDELLKKYRKIKYIHDSVEFDISIIVNAYNFVMPISTFPNTLINFNHNLKNLYMYGHNLKYPLKLNYTIHKMMPSSKYVKLIWNKWKNTKKQLYLMIHEKCIKNKMISYSLKYLY